MTPVRVKGLSEQDADRLVKTVTKSGATNVKKTKEKKGTFTVTFDEPDDDDD
jgi:predicted lactoylglutathione lyase